MKSLRLALTKGRIEKDAAELFARMGLDTSALKNKGRKLIIPVGDIEVVLAKATDVITYVEHGACDIGIVGKDTIMEGGGRIFEVLDLGFGRCKFALAAPSGRDFYGGYNIRTIASKYPNVTRIFFAERMMDVEVIKIEGSVELAPIIGLSDAIVDIVETGNTLRANGLSVVEEIADVSARVIVNMAGMKLHKREIEELVGKMAECL